MRGEDPDGDGDGFGGTLLCLARKRVKMVWYGEVLLPNARLLPGEGLESVVKLFWLLPSRW